MIIICKKSKCKYKDEYGFCKANNNAPAGGVAMICLYGEIKSKYPQQHECPPMPKVKPPKKETYGAVKIQLDAGAIMPTRAHDTDAGLDLYAMHGAIIPAKESAVFDTGVHIQLPPQTVGLLKSKSGLNVKHGITSEGVIDVGYTGSIVAKLYNNSGYDYTVNAGDKITQLVIMPILTPTLEVVESLEETERGAGGFGSTGK
jgi:dUTP pyrophosphatase